MLAAFVGRQRLNVGDLRLERPRLGPSTARNLEIVLQGNDTKEDAGVIGMRTLGGGIRNADRASCLGFEPNCFLWTARTAVNAAGISPQDTSNSVVIQEFFQLCLARNSTVCRPN